MELAFTFPDPLNTTLFCPKDAADSPSYAVHTERGVTTIEKQVAVPEALEGLEDQDVEVREAQTILVVRLHWQHGGSTLCVGDCAWENEKPIHSFMPRERWYANSRTFVSQGVTYVWRDWPIQPLQLFRAKESKPVAVLYGGSFEQWHLRVQESALDMIDTVVVTGMVMLKKRLDRKRGHD